MAYYGRMEVMRMSDEEIRRILEEEGDTLEEGTAALMLEELKKRSEQTDDGADLGLSEEELAELNAEADDEPEEDGQTEEGSGEEPEDLSDEEKLARLEKELEAENKESKRTLIIACAAAGVVAVVSIAAILILRALGKF